MSREEEVRAYYRALEEAVDPWRRSGWRRRIEQAYRFEAVLQTLPSTPCTLLDVGCGTCGLATYLQESGTPHRVVGLEFRRLPEHRCWEVVHGDFRCPPPLPDYDFGIAVGASTGWGKSAVGPLLRICGRARGGFRIVELDERLEWSRSAGEPALRPIVRDAWAGEGVEAFSVSPRDVLLHDGAAHDAGDRARFVATVDGPWGREGAPSEHAWLAAELGLWDEVRERLAQLDELDELARIVRERVELNAPVGAGDGR